MDDYEKIEKDLQKQYEVSTATPVVSRTVYGHKALCVCVLAHPCVCLCTGICGEVQEFTLSGAAVVRVEPFRAGQVGGE